MEVLLGSTFLSFLFTRHRMPFLPGVLILSGGLLMRYAL